MNLIPTSWKILWNVWDVRMLVLLSFTLQIILFVFGKHRKNVSSKWINVIVWLAYLMADWVATLALASSLMPKIIFLIPIMHYRHYGHPCFYCILVA
ncbi:hypothetical protein ACSBR2_025214 [Camellia fascicularis]